MTITPAATTAARTMLPFEQWKVVTMLWQLTQAAEHRDAGMVLHNCFAELDDLVDLQHHHLLIDAIGAPTPGRPIYRSGQRVDLAADVPPRAGVNVATALAGIRLQLTAKGGRWIDHDPHSRAVRAVDAYASPQLVRQLVQQNNVDPEALVRLAEAGYAGLFGMAGAVEPPRAGRMLRTGGVRGPFGDLTAKLTTRGTALVHPVV